VIKGMRANARPDRIQLDIPIALEQIGLTVYEAGLESTVPQRSGSLHRVVEEADIATPDALHQPAYAPGTSRGDQQVHVVAHQNVGVDTALEAHRLFEQVAKVFQVVDPMHEAWPTVDAPLHDVLGDRCGVETAWPGHAPTMRRARAKGCRETSESKLGL
jgi:hypothetical protein